MRFKWYNSIVQTYVGVVNPCFADKESLNRLLAVVGDVVDSILEDGFDDFDRFVSDPDEKGPLQIAS